MIQVHSFYRFIDEKHRLLSQVVRPQESRSLSPSHVTEDRQSRWKEEERKSDRKESSRRYEEPEFKERISSSDKQREQPDASEGSRSRVQESLGRRPSEERDASDRMHDDSKKKSKIQKKATKKKKDDDSGVERYTNESTTEESQVFSPKKGQKKKNVEKKRKRSKGDSEVSDEEIVPHHKKKKGPRTPPVTKEELVEAPPEKAVAEVPQKREETTFSDWSDEDVPERGDIVVPERSTEESHRKSHRMRVEKVEAPHVTIDDGPHRKPVDQKRSSSLGSNRSHASSRLRSPSNESAHRSGDDQTGRKRILHSTSRDRDREKKSLEISGERKSRIDQLKRGEPSRSTSSGKNIIFSESGLLFSAEVQRYKSQIVLVWLYALLICNQYEGRGKFSAIHSKTRVNQDSWKRYCV